jgi:hypothetical protein
LCDEISVVSCRGNSSSLLPSNTFEGLTAKRQPGYVFKSKLAQDLNEAFHVSLYQGLLLPPCLSKEQGQHLCRKCTECTSKEFEVNKREQHQRPKQNQTLTHANPSSSHNSKVLTIVNPIKQQNNTNKT